ncbi:MAG: phosphoenolpyruvate hydrolase family protein [Spirochaetota bacterium]|nr:MAG: phosphoenolpyruvate hydrolase family protein [Spirochaetota bacterium]
MAKRYTRDEVLRRLKEQIKEGKPILMFGAGIGLTAKSAELGGADIIAVYSTAIYRMRGLPTLMAFMPYSDANEHVRTMAREILPAVKEAPCIVGIGAHDPTLNQEAFMDEMLGMGFSGVTNEPFAGIYGPDFAAQLESAGIGFSREAEMIERAHKKDIFTAGWAFNPEEARMMAEVGADVVGALIGVTVGGLTGAKKSLSLEEATESVQAMCEAAKKVNPDVMILSHGGPFKDPETAEYSITNSDAVGYAAGSSGERMPTEKAVSEVTSRYKAMRLKK